jgi:1-pyrroline-5-carboxylate dehydrogenase
MCEEIFGPVLSVYVYNDERFEETLALCERTSPYGLTGAIFARDRRIVHHMCLALENAAGNFYINDKCTGAVVGQQPFGGGRASGTNDKAGSKLNLARWMSVRTVKEVFVPPVRYEYPFMKEP